MQKFLAGYAVCDIALGCYRTLFLDVRFISGQAVVLRCFVQGGSLTRCVDAASGPTEAGMSYRFGSDIRLLQIVLW